jgi:hypothetical protein
MVNEDHGDPRHITLNHLNAAAEAAGIAVEDVVRNIEDAALTSGEEGAEREAARAGSRGRNRS